MPDAKIVFNTELDNKQLEKDLAKLSGQISRQEQKLSKQKQERLPLADQAKEAAAALDDAKYKLAELQKLQAKNMSELSLGQTPSDIKAYIDAYGQKDRIVADVARQQKAVDGLQKEWDSVAKKVEVYDAKIKAAEETLVQTKAEAGAVSDQIQAMSSGGSAMGDAMAKAETYMERFSVRIKGLAKRALVFSVITAGLRHMRDWLWSIIQTDQQATAAVAQMKGSLLTLAQPLVSAVIPAFTMFVRVLTSVISTLAQLTAMLTGKSFSAMKNGVKAANKQAKAIQGIGGAAKEASRYLAGFDELNVMPDNSEGGGGGGPGMPDTPDFDFGGEKSEDQLRNILGLIEMVAAGLLALKFGTGFLDGLQKAVGYLMIMDGAVRFITTYFDAWENGLSFENINTMLGGLLEIIMGLYLAIGPTAAAIGMIVGGLSMVALGIKDIIKNGLTLENMILTISGILIAAVGIAALTGSWIPLVIGAIAGLLLVITNFFGDTDRLVGGMQEILKGFKEFFAGVFSGDIEQTCNGIFQMFHGMQEVLLAVIDAMKNMIFSFLDWLDEKTGGKLHGIIEAIKGFFGSAFQFISDGVTSVMSGVEAVLSGLIIFLSGVFTGNWSRAWEGVKQVFTGAWNGIVGLLESAINFIIRGINWLTSKMNQISFDVPDWVPGIGGKSMGVNLPTIAEYQIPRLAKGAVIPPNQEFLAVLGDQRHGTNIEAPLETIQKAVALVMSDFIDSNMAGHEATVALLREILEAVLGIQIGDEVIGHAVERYRQKMAIVQGG